jgi:predicted phosphodiesterase
MRGAKTSAKGNIVKEYLEKFPTLSIRAIASKIWENDDVKAGFKDYEDVRNVLRHYTGTKGLAGRNQLADKRFIRTDLPSQKPKEFEDYTLPTANRNILVMSDIHLPYQDNEALSLAIEYGIEHKVDTVILNGDVTDFYAVSRFEIDYRKRDLPEELYTTRDFYQTLRKAFPNALIIAKVGNHDDRWQQYLLKHFLKGIEEIELYSLFKFAELGIKEVASMSIIWAGKLAILHGHEHRYGMIAPVNPARGLFLRTKQSALIGHVHRTSEHTEKTLDGKLIGTWSTGCLTTLEPHFMRFNNHNHGFAHIELEKDGMFTVYNRKIINGRIL